MKELDAKVHTGDVFFLATFTGDDDVVDRAVSALQDEFEDDDFDLGVD